MPIHNASRNLAGSQGSAVNTGSALDSLTVSKLHEVHEINAVTSPGLALCGSSKLGVFGATPVTQQAALTPQLTTITIADAEGTPDYALQALTTTTPYGLATAAEAISVLYVIKNLQVRLAEVEAILETLGFCAAN